MSDGGRTWHRAARFATPATVLLCAGLLAWVQFSFDGLYDGDGYFHTRAARELADHGIRPELQQAAFSTWSVRYSDKDFLYHALLIPFQWAFGSDGDLVPAGKAAAAFVDLVLLAAVAFSLRLVGARFIPLWILLLFSTHVSILGNLLSVRPHVLGVAFLVVEAALLVRRSVWPLAGLAAVHVSTHSSFVFLPFLAFAVVATVLARREPVPWRSVSAAVAGLVVGNLVHPYFPNNVTLTWDQTVEVARNAWSATPAIPLELFGGELEPTRFYDFMSCFPGWLPAALGLAVLIVRRTRLSTEAAALAAMSAGLLGLAFRSQRFIVFFVPVATLLAGRLWTEISERAGKHLARAAAAALLACLAVGQYKANVVRVHGIVESLYTRSLERSAVEFLRAQAAPDELVYHNFWRDFSVLYHYRPEGRYIVGLDPIFLYRHDPDRFRGMLAAYRGEAPAHDVVAGEFGARWVYVSRASRHEPFLDGLRRDGRFRRVYADANAEVYLLTTTR